MTSPKEFKLWTLVLVWLPVILASEIPGQDGLGGTVVNNRVHYIIYSQIDLYV